MELIDEIRLLFANSEPNKAYPIELIDSEYLTVVFRDNDCYGVAFPYDGESVYEEFSNAYLFNSYRKIGSTECNWLFLSSSLEEARNTFAVICADFVKPGEGGSQRRELKNNPSAWWKKWKTTIGNRNSVKQPHSVIGELLVYSYLLRNNIQCIWNGSSYSTHDISTSEVDYEVKSSLKRYGKIITVNGQFQLIDDQKKLDLIYIRFEKDKNGLSINDMVKSISNLGIDADELNVNLENIGYRIGNSSRKEKFKILESVRYHVDQSFPRIVPASFKDGVIPQGINHIIYDLDLSILNGETIDLD